MKKILLVLPLLGLVFAGCEKKSSSTSTEPTLAQKTETAVANAADKTKEMAVNTKDAISDKLADWKLTPSDIKADLEKGGRVVRSKTAAAGASAERGPRFDLGRGVPPRLAGGSGGA